MLRTIRKMQYRAQANVPGAKAELEERLHDRLELPLSGIHNEKLYLTGISQLEQKAAELRSMYDQLPKKRGMADRIILDAHSSATIEGARTTVARVRACFDCPITKDDRMVVNTVIGSKYAYNRSITQKNLRTLWETITNGVCENKHLDGKLYRAGMVEIGNVGRTVHIPATPQRIPELMEQWFSYREKDRSLIGSFVSHFYFVYIHPFCDGNGRTARIINASTLYHNGWDKMRSLPMSSAINNNLQGYYRSLEDSEIPIQRGPGCWLDLSPFVSYMLDTFEQCLIDAALSQNRLTPNEQKLLGRMNQVNGIAQITTKNAARILGNSESAARKTLRNLVEKGYLTVTMDKIPYIYSLEPNIPLDFLDYDIEKSDTMSRTDLNTALNDINTCTVPKLQNHSVLNVIEKEDFYYPSPLIQTKSDSNKQVILFSAPGAVGKTALAKHIAYQKGALYWDVAQSSLNGTAFAGQITHAVGVGHGAQQDELYRKLKCGECLVVLDAFDEAALISRRDGISSFLEEISGILADATAPSIIMTARTEMAQFIQSVCEEVGLRLAVYEIDYFEENEAVNFIASALEFKGMAVYQEHRKNIELYISTIKNRLGEENNPKSFIGYAQVLSILARQLEKEYKDNPRLDNIASLVQIHGGDRLIYDIIQQLIQREESKLANFKDTIRHKYKGNEDVVDMLYSKKEQLLRLQFYVFADTIAIDDYALCGQLNPDDQMVYLDLLKDWLPQHVFLHNGKVMPIFCDYLLAESLLDNELELFTDEYKKKLPTRVFMDCYLSLNNDAVHSEHIYYLDLAFSSQVGMDSIAYCDISSADDAENDSSDNLSLNLTLTTNGAASSTLTPIRILRDPTSPICLCRAENMSINVDGKVILSPNFLQDVTIRNSTIECDDLVLDAREVIFESYGNEENHVIVHKDITRLPGSSIMIKGTSRLKIELPAENIKDYKRKFYEFTKYLCHLSADSENDGCNDSIEIFVHALKKVLEQFRVDRYDSDPAKFKEKIDARCHTGCKARVLDFLKSIDLIYEDGMMYKASLTKMDEMHISRVAYIHFKYEQLQPAYERYCSWLATNS